MSWLRGDLAVCIRDDWPNEPARPLVGDVLRVAAVDRCPCCRGQALVFARFADTAWDARCFRKAVRDDRPAENEFAARIRDCRTVDA